MPTLSHAQLLRRCRRAFALLFAICAIAATLCAQSGVVDADDDAVDPVRLFNQGQEEHARQHFARALELYDAALKIRPVFPEADYQKGLALMSLNRLSEAEQTLRRAAVGHTDWPLPQTALGLLLVRLKRDQEAEPFLRRALALKTADIGTLVALASLRLRAGDKAEALRLIQQATDDPRADAQTWAMRAGIERANGDITAADIFRRDFSWSKRNRLESDAGEGSGDGLDGFSGEPDCGGSEHPLDCEAWHRKVTGLSLLEAFLRFFW